MLDSYCKNKCLFTNIVLDVVYIERSRKARTDNVLHKKNVRKIYERFLLL